MPKLLDVNDLMEVYDLIETPTMELEAARDRLIFEINKFAEKLANELGVRCERGEWEGKLYAGICVPFYPSYEGQPLPVEFEKAKVDIGGEW